MDGDQDRRSGERKRVFKQVRLLINPPNGTVEAIARDLSETGAKLELAVETALPDKFGIIFTLDHVMRDAELVWQAGKYAGARFTGKSSSVRIRKFS
jgi:PilZ domain